MTVDKKTLLLYAVTDRSWLHGRTLREQVEDCLTGGVTMVQLREKELDDRAFLAEAVQIKALCKKYNVPFILNDNVQIAVSADADGVHVGQSDMDVKAARSRIGRDRILGVSVQTVKQAVMAQQDGADYLGVGAVFPTATKTDADAVTPSTLKMICDAVSIPVVAIGGINRHNILKLRGTGIDGVAVVSAIFAEENIMDAAKHLLALSKETVSA